MSGYKWVFTERYLNSASIMCPMSTAEIKQIMDKLDNITSELGFIKEHITDVDLVLTEDDLDSIQEAERDIKLRKTKRLN
jgi:hypothetical protein